MRVGNSEGSAVCARQDDAQEKTKTPLKLTGFALLVENTGFTG
jgi:hypothetical protein